jgi:hypothetical protein
MPTLGKTFYEAVTAAKNLDNNLMNSYARQLIDLTPLAELKNANEDQITTPTPAQQEIMINSENASATISSMVKDIVTAASPPEIARISERAAANLIKDNPNAMSFIQKFVEKIREITGIRPTEKGQDTPGMSR